MDSVYLKYGIGICVILIIGFLIQYLRERWIMKKELKEAVLGEWEKAKKKEQEIVGLSLDYRAATQILPDRAKEIDKNIKDRVIVVDKKVDELTNFFTPSPKWPWKHYANHFWYENDIPDRFLKAPRLTIKILSDKLEELGELLSEQRRLIAAFKRALNPTQSWKDEQGEVIYISKVERYSIIEAAENQRSEEETENARNFSEMEMAESNLAWALENVRRHGFTDSSIIGNARYLDPKMVEKFGKQALEKVAKLKSKGADPTKITLYCKKASREIDVNFGEWAQKIAGEQSRFDSVLEELKNLEEISQVELVAHKELVSQLLNLFQDPISKKWSTAKWEALKIDLKETESLINDSASLKMRLKDSLHKIAVQDDEIMAVTNKEKELKEDYGVTVPSSGDWRDALADWETILKLWAAGKLDKVEDILEAITTPLDQHDFKVRNKFDETVRQLPDRTVEDIEIKSKLTEMSREEIETPSSEKDTFVYTEKGFRRKNNSSLTKDHG